MCSKKGAAAPAWHAQRRFCAVAEQLRQVQLRQVLCLRPQSLRLVVVIEDDGKKVLDHFLRDSRVEVRILERDREHLDEVVQREERLAASAQHYDALVRCQKAVLLLGDRPENAVRLVTVDKLRGVGRGEGVVRVSNWAGRESERRRRRLVG